MSIHDPESDGTAASPAAGRLRKRRALGCLFEVVETLVLTLVIFLGVQAFVAQPYKVQMGSMETTLMPDQYVLVDKLTPRWTPYARGNIVVLNPPPSSGVGQGAPFIKRVIGLPGERLELRGGLVYINGVALDEPYIYADNGVRQTSESSVGGPSTWVIPPGQLFVMGDHRQASEDSRVFGPIEISHVIGRAWLRYWPLGTFGMLPSPSYPASSQAP
jgi:signal peptidase I